jgi:hypothetical protein
VGADGFQSFATRALALAMSEPPRLNAAKIMANGDLRGLGEIESKANPDEDGEVGIILIAQLLGLFLTLLGEATSEARPAAPTKKRRTYKQIAYMN